jgi:ABC-2 type transport system permease protein
VNPAITWATARRALRQLRHDPRTVALLVIVPAALLTLVRYMLDTAQAFSHAAPVLLGIFPFLLLFLVTSVTMLRERTSGTLERLLTTALGKLDLLLGYGIAFTAVALVSVGVSVAVSVLLGMHLAGGIGWLLLVASIDAILGIALGLLCSAFATTEFQALQMMPIIVLPQLLVCGLFVPRVQMAAWLRWAADVLPVPYAAEALQQVALDGSIGAAYTRDVAVLFASAAAALLLGAATLRRRTD